MNVITARPLLAPWERVRHDGQAWFGGGRRKEIWYLLAVHLTVMTHRIPVTQGKVGKYTSTFETRWGHMIMRYCLWV